MPAHFTRFGWYEITQDSSYHGLALKKGDRFLAVGPSTLDMCKTGTLNFDPSMFVPCDPPEENTFTIIKRGGKTYLHLPHGSDLRIETRSDHFGYSLNLDNTDKEKIVFDTSSCCFANMGLTRVFRSSLKFMSREREGTLLNGELDPETGINHQEKNEKKKKKERLRKELPLNRCLFCKNLTDTRHVCGVCDDVMFAPCSQCLKMGAPEIHAPRRMSKVQAKEGMAYVCYPQCARVAAFRCRQCARWYDKTLVHKVIRQEGNVTWCLCTKCATENGESVCNACHQVIERRSIKNGICRRCREGYCGGSFTCKEAKTKVICKSKTPKRTYGVELEINNVQHLPALADIVGGLDIGGVQFGVRYDGSVHSGCEIVSSPGDKSALLPALRSLVSVTGKFAHSFDRSGTHIHVSDPRIVQGLRVKDGLALARVIQAWAALEPLTFSMLPTYRRDNTFCSRICKGGATFDKLLKINDYERAIKDMYGFGNNIGMETRYTALNIYSIPRHGTIEFRCFPSTDKYEDLKLWIVYLDAMMRFALRKTTTEKKLIELYDLCGNMSSDNITVALGSRFLRLSLANMRNVFSEITRHSSGKRYKRENIEGEHIFSYLPDPRKYGKLSKRGMFLLPSSYFTKNKTMEDDPFKNILQGSQPVRTGHLVRMMNGNTLMYTIEADSTYDNLSPTPLL